MIINLSGDVGFEITENGLRSKLAGLDEDVTLKVNSPGGYIFEGFGIYNAIQDYRKEKKKRVDVIINGLAASAASYFIMAADSIKHRENAVFMAHKAWAFMIGNADDLEKEAEILSGIDGIIAEAYAKKTGENKEDILEKMKNDLWLFADEIQEAGYSDGRVPIDEPAGDVEAFTPAEARARVSAAKNRVEKMIENSADMESKRAAWINSITTESFGNGETVNNDQKNKTEVQTMNLQQFKAQSPEAMAEFNAAIAGEVTKERARIAEIAACAGLIMSEGVKAAIESGADAGVFAIAQLKEQNKKHAVSNEAQKIGEILASSQTPADAVEPQEENENEIKTEEQARKAAEEFAKKHGGVK